MNPGATMSPRASTTRAARDASSGVRESATIRSPRIAMSAE
jgi:hypothetical protein